MKLEDILEESDSLTAWKLEVARLQRELREAQALAGERREREQAALEENRKLRELIARIAASAMAVGSA